MAKKDKIAAQSAPHDEALFEALGKNKKKKKRKILITVVVAVCILAVGGVVGVRLLQRQVRERFVTTSAQVLSYQVSTGSISTVVSGSGRLADVDLQQISVPDGVEVTEILVKANDTVQAGDVLATVDMASVMSTMAQLQSQIEALDEQLSDAEDDAAASTIYAGVSGRVKVLYAASGDAVSDVMYENGALALLSLDGYMAVDLQTDALTAGDSVSVLRADGTSISGTVERAAGTTATVLVTDNGPEYDELVTVLDETGNTIGTGTLYVHSPLRITGYAGTVKQVRVKCNSTVSEKTRLFTLQDTGYRANYETLLRSRKELEQTLLELLTLRRDGALLATASARVYSVDDGDNDVVLTLSADEKMSVTISVDESDILSLALGQEVSVTVSLVRDDAFTGTLTQIDHSGSSAGDYTAVVELAKSEGMLAGMTASVSVKIEGVEDALLIPVEALHQTSEGAFVYTSYDDQLQEYGGRVDVITGLENSSYVEIKSGLQVGDTVYYTQQESDFGSFGAMGGFAGMSGMSGADVGGNFGGGEMPGFNGGEMPDMGGEKPNFGGDGAGNGRDRDRGGNRG